MNTITVLTDIKQLESKTIKLINVHEVDEVTTLFYTSCNCILVETKKAGFLYGEEHVDTAYMGDMVEVYEFYGDELVDLGILTQVEANTLQGVVTEKEARLARHRKDSQELIDRAKYEELKKRFEVDWNE